MTNPRAPSELVPMAAEAARLKPLTAERTAYLKANGAIGLHVHELDLNWDEIDALLAINDALRDGLLRDVSGARTAIVRGCGEQRFAGIDDPALWAGDHVLILPARKDGP